MFVSIVRTYRRHETNCSGEKREDVERERREGNWRGGVERSAEMEGWVEGVTFS